jgi:hypothetical protein
MRRLNTHGVWTLPAEFISCLLEPDERDAVLGDLVESRETQVKTLLAVFGLVVRRQTALWDNWRPWLAVVGLICIVGPLLRLVSLQVGAPLFMNFRTFWKYGSLYPSGMTVSEEVVVCMCGALGLLLWSWTSGFVLGSLSQRTIWTTALLYYSPILIFLLSLLSLGWKSLHSHSPDLPMVWLATAIQAVQYAVLFFIPSVLGLRQGLRKIALTLPSALLLAAVILSMTALATWIGGWPAAAVMRWAGGAWDASVGWRYRLLFLGVLSWPANYLLAIALVRRRAVAT